MNKTCFVIMGFGFKNGLDLDRTYLQIIKPVIKKNKLIPCLISNSKTNLGYRSDEISTGNLIDYKFIYCIKNADIVIADISIMNNNAIYELGIRHTLKPKTTIILCDNQTFESTSFFDIHDINQIIYKRDFSDISLAKKQLTLRIREAVKSDEKYIDNPVQRCLFEINECDKSDILKLERKSIYRKYNVIKELIDSEKYSEALNYFSNNNISFMENEEMFNLYTLAKYKVCYSKRDARGLFDILNLLSESKYLSTNYELYGRQGAINYRLYLLLDNKLYLKEAEKSYYLGAKFDRGDYYCQRNHCFMLLLNASVTEDNEKALEYIYSAKYFSDLYLSNTYPNSLTNLQKFYRLYNTQELKAIRNFEYEDFDDYLKMANDCSLSKRQKTTIINGMSTYKDLIDKISIKLSLILKKDIND